MATQPLSNSTRGPSYIDESRYERIDGRLIPRPMPGDVHSDVQDRIKSLLRELLKDRPFVIRSEWSMTRPDSADLIEPDYMTPDVLVAYEPYERSLAGHLIRRGFLAVEVLSPRQESLFRKAERYGAWGIEHVWIVDPQTAEAFEFHGGNRFTLVNDRLNAGDVSISIEEILNAGHSAS